MHSNHFDFSSTKPVHYTDRDTQLLLPPPTSGSISVDLLPPICDSWFKCDINDHEKVSETQWRPTHEGIGLWKDEDSVFADDYANKLSMDNASLMNIFAQSPTPTKPIVYPYADPTNNFHYPNITAQLANLNQMTTTSFSYRGFTFPSHVPTSFYEETPQHMDNGPWEYSMKPSINYSCPLDINSIGPIPQYSSGQGVFELNSGREIIQDAMMLARFKIDNALMDQDYSSESLT